MKSRIYAYFFKKEKSNLTLEEIHEKNYLAAETKNGFIEVARFHELELNSDIFYSKEESKKVDNELISFLINGFKKNTPPLMMFDNQYFDGSFGGS
jgi:hypothetical protein